MRAHVWVVSLPVYPNGVLAMTQKARLIAAKLPPVPYIVKVFGPGEQLSPADFWASSAAARPA